MSDERAAPLLRQTFRDWIRHGCISKGAALAFYVLLSFAPLLVLVIGSTTAFAELKDSLNEIWSEHIEPASGLFGAEFTRLYALQHGSLRRKRKPAIPTSNTYKHRTA